MDREGLRALSRQGKDIVRYIATGLILFFTLTGMAGASQESARSKLETARETLRLSEVTYERIAADLEQLKSSGNASPELIRNYEIYLQRVGEMREENRRILESMEKAFAASASSQKTAPASEPDPSVPKRDVKIPEEGETDRIASLDRQLKESLASFDEMLLKEMDKIRTASGDKMRGLAREAAAAAKGIKEAEESSSQQSDSGDEKRQPVGESQGEDAAQAPGASKDKDSGVQEAKTGSQARPSGSPSGKDDSARPTGRGPDSSSQDDDIVARQLREAAEKETDPVLKEKLWKEYEDYKKSRRQ
jgi:hypothetical protein